MKLSEFGLNGFTPRAGLGFPAGFVPPPPLGGLKAVWQDTANGAFYCGAQVTVGQTGWKVHSAKCADAVKWSTASFMISGVTSGGVQYLKLIEQSAQSEPVVYLVQLPVDDSAPTIQV